MLLTHAFRIENILYEIFHPTETSRYTVAYMVVDHACGSTFKAPKHCGLNARYMYMYIHVDKESNSCLLKKQ